MLAHMNIHTGDLAELPARGGRLGLVILSPDQRRALDELVATFGAAEIARRAGLGTGVIRRARHGESILPSSRLVLVSLLDLLTRGSR